MLEVQFHLLRACSRREQDGITRMQGFEVRHDKLGLILSVDAKGTVTFVRRERRGVPPRSTPWRSRMATSPRR